MDSPVLAGVSSGSPATRAVAQLVARLYRQGMATGAVGALSGERQRSVVVVVRMRRLCVCAECQAKRRNKAVSLGVPAEDAHSLFFRWSFYVLRWCPRWLLLALNKPMTKFLRRRGIAV